MQKDIQIPKAKDVYIVAVLEWNEEFTSQNWNVYLVNNREDNISTVLVMSRGKSEDRKTSTLRHGLGDIEAKSSCKVEMITNEVLSFTNEYMLTFFVDNKLYEANFLFEPNSISENNTTKIPVIQQEGIMAIK